MANGFILGASLSHVAGHNFKYERKLVFNTLLTLLRVLLALWSKLPIGPLFCSIASGFKKQNSQLKVNLRYGICCLI